MQSIFAIFYAGFSTGAFEKSTSMRVQKPAGTRKCHNGETCAVTGGHRGALLSCSICNLRKEKRFCLALHGRICAQCCGEQREVTLDCPAECPYLQQARLHEKPREFGETPPAETFPAIALREEFISEHEMLIAGILQTLGRVTRADRSLHDRDLIGSLANMAQSYQTLIASGLVYQEALPNPVQLAVISVLQELFEEFREVEQKNRGYTTLKDGDVLQGLVFMLRLIHMHSSGRPLARGFIDFLQERFPEPQPTLDGEGERGGIIMP